MPSIINDQKTAAVQTTDATLTTIATIPITASSTTVIEAIVTALQSTFANGRIWQFILGARDNGGVSAILGTLQGLLNGLLGQGDVGSNAWTADLIISGTNVLIRVTGLVATTINWRVDYKIRTHTP